MSGLRDSRWRAVATLATVSVALATIATLTSTVATDHAWALAILVVAAGVVRAACEGGVTSIMCLAGTMVIGQPIMHLIGELTHSHALAASHSVVACLVLIAFHVALFVVLTALTTACDTAGRALLARFRRLVRVVLRTVGPVQYDALPLRFRPPARRPKQRLSARLPERRGPPAVLVALAS